LQCSNCLVQAYAPTVPTIGWLSLGTELSVWSALEGFRSGLADLGYTEGKNIRVQRYADGNADRLSALTGELVSLGATIIAYHTTAIRAVHDTAPNVPIVPEPLFSFLIPSCPLPCSTAPQAFSRPDRVLSQAGARRAGRSSAATCYEGPTTDSAAQSWRPSPGCSRRTSHRRGRSQANRSFRRPPPYRSRFAHRFQYAVFRS
jgi:hypothetical protein